MRWNGIEQFAKRVGVEQGAGALARIEFGETGVHGKRFLDRLLKAQQHDRRGCTEVVDRDAHATS